MIGVKVAITNGNASISSLLVQMQIKNNDDIKGLRLTELQDDERLPAVKYNKHGLSGSSRPTTPCNDNIGRSQSQHDLDSGVSLCKDRGGHIMEEETSSAVVPRSPRSKLHTNHIVTEENMFSEFGSRLNFSDLSVLELQAALDYSQSYCNTLRLQLREAKNALVLQSERLHNIESAALNNSVLVDDLKFKEMEYRKVIDNFEVSVKEKQQLQLQNLRLREDLQERLDALDLQLRTHNIHLHSKECKHHHNTCLHFKACDLYLLEDANKRLELMNKGLIAELASVRSCYAQALQQVTAVEQSKAVLQSQQQTTEQKRSWLQSEVERLLQDNKNIKQAIENSFTKTNYEKLQEEYRKLETDHGNLKHEYNLLNYKHQDFIISHTKEREVAERENQEMIMLKKERDALVKQVAVLQDKLSLVEDSKKQADGQINKLKSELAEVNVKMKQNNSNKETVLEEQRSLKQEVEMLKQHIGKAKEREVLQEKMLTNLKKEHLESANSELENLRSKLQELMQEMRNKEQIIEKLKLELKSSNELVQEKECEIQELHKVVERLEQEKQALLQEIQMLRDWLEAELSQKHELERRTLKRSQSSQSLQDELSKEDRSEMYGSYDYDKSLELRSSSVPPLSTEPGKTQQKGQYGGWFFVLPEKSEAQGGNRLQNLISKYRSHSESEIEDQRLAGKPLSGSVSPNLLSRSRFSEASHNTSASKNYTDGHRSLPTIQEKGRPTAGKFSRSSTNPLSPTPASRQSSSIQSSFMQTASAGDAKRELTSMSPSVRRMLPSVVSGKANSG